MVYLEKEKYVFWVFLLGSIKWAKLSYVYYNNFVAWFRKPYLEINVQDRSQHWNEVVLFACCLYKYLFFTQECMSISNVSRLRSTLVLFIPFLEKLTSRSMCKVEANIALQCCYLPVAGTNIFWRFFTQECTSILTRL